MCSAVELADVDGTVVVVVVSSSEAVVESVEWNIVVWISVVVDVGVDVVVGVEKVVIYRSNQCCYSSS